MKKLLSVSFVLLLLSACNQSPAVEKSAKLPAVKDSAGLVKYGEHLVTIAGCHDCHSPKKMGPNGPEIIPESMLSGYPAGKPITGFDTALAKRGIAQMSEDMTASAGPWGISFASNLTSDATGAGSWPLENLKIALRQGKAKGIKTSRMLLPPMPWFNYKEMTDEEIEAIHAYLKSVPPVKNVAPEPVLFSH